MADRPNPSSRLSRTAKVGGLVAGQSARVAGGRALDRVRTDDAKERAQRKRTSAVVEQIVVQLGQMKGAAMKFGQVLSTVDLPGLEPEDAERIKTRLAELRDQAPRVPYKDLERLMAREWGQPVGRVLEDIDPEAVAAASIGQVHRARTREGRDVAIKVQYPGIAEAVDTDLRNAQLLFPLLGRIAPGLDVKAVGDELRERISEELDYELEAQSQRAVARGWRGHPHLLVPGVDTELSTRRVLVTDFVEGAAFGDVRARDEATRDRVAEVIHRFFHDTAGRLDIALGDPHPGNVLLAGDGRLCFLDFGMVRRMSPGYLREREGAVYRALRDGDAEAVRATMTSLGYLPPAWDHPTELLYRHLRLAAGWMLDVPQPYRFGSGAAGELMREMVDLGPEWRAMVRDFALPREALLLRRMMDIVFAVCSDLRARADWKALGDELLAGEPPRTALGREHADWLAGR
jgi:predicted unusual protein kinase regulating ubiquinone biosynthesis (AarF/ABC1/UbiB family)